MNVIYKSCCGIDVHKMKLVACLKKGKKQTIKEFSAESKDIRELSDWLIKNKCEMVAMESTASYWKPLVNIFELKGIKYIVINAKEYKNVPGRKTDVLDSEWIADLLKHGLLKASYIPSRDQRELREATRYRKSITEERSRELNRLQKMLEGANIKISSVLSEITGKACMNLIDYVINNDENVTIEVAEKLVSKRVNATLDSIVDSMDGILTPFQKTMLNQVIIHIKELTKRIEEMDKIIDDYMKDYQVNLQKLIKVPGIGKKSAEIILAEIGQDMSKFPTEGHISSWSGVCPGNNESAGKRRSGRTRKGNKTLKSQLAQCAKAASKNKNTFYYAQYQKISMKRGKGRATMAVAHSMLISIYHIIKDDLEFNDLGADFYNKFNPEKKINSYLKKLKELGYELPEATVN